VAKALLLPVHHSAEDHIGQEGLLVRKGVDKLVVMKYISRIFLLMPLSHCRGICICKQLDHTVFIYLSHLFEL
jgi:hypothetical protein